MGARQANSLLIEMSGKFSSAHECRKAHIETLEGKISSAQNQIRKWEKKLADIPYPCCSIRRNQYKTEQHRLRHNIHHKRRYLIAQQWKLEQLRNTQLEVNFGSTLCFTLVGSQGESNGNQICQYDYKKKQLKIRVPVEWEAEFGGKYIYADLEFKYGQDCIVAALMKRAVNRNTGDVILQGKGEALTWRFFNQNNRWYISVTVEVSDTPIQSFAVRYGCIGVDFNPGVVGWCYSDYNGNPVKWGQFKVNLHSRRAGQVEAQLADVIKKLLELADNNCCPIVIENLSFSAKKKKMREESRRYARMLNYFAYSKFNNLIIRQCNNRGIELNIGQSCLLFIDWIDKVYGVVRHEFRHRCRFSSCS